MTTLKMEIQTSPGVWFDISIYVYQRDPLTISRGRSDEQSQASPQRLSFTLDNRTGIFSTRNPLSSLYGKIGRNAPVRCTIDGTFTRFYGEISELPPRWDESHSDNYVPVEAYGILRRLGQGQPPVSNALQDWVLAQSTLAAYYPMTGGSDTVSMPNLAPGKTGTFAGYGGAVFTLGADMGAAWLGTGLQINATGDLPYLQGGVSALKSNVALDFVFQSAAIGVLDVQLWTGYDQFWNLRLNTSASAGTFQVSFNDGTSAPNNYVAVGPIPELSDMELHTCRFELDSIAGPDIQFTVYIDGQSLQSNTFGGSATIGFVPFFRLHYSRFTDQTTVNLAHMAVWADNTAANIPSVQDYTDAAFAYTGELALDRIARVASDGAIPLSVVGTDSEPMGPQFTETRLEQIRDVETTDMGILLEQRSTPGLLYLARTSLYNQSAAFTLLYNGGQVVAPLEPIVDDSLTRNDVTATRRDGGSARVTIDTGPLSTADPPTGVGRYETEVTVNVETDDMLDAFAGWVANIGTLDEARWPSVTVNLNVPGISSTLRSAIRNADIGSRFVITGMSKAFIYDDVSLIIVGYTETIDPFIHTITFNCMPAEPYEVFVVEDSGSRISSGDTSLVNASMTTTATTMSVLSADGSTLWDTAGDDFSIMVAGEEMLCTAISGTTPGSAQSFTVARSQNGVVKTHSSGEIVRLKRRAVLAL